MILEEIHVKMCKNKKYIKSSAWLLKALKFQLVLVFIPSGGRTYRLLLLQLHIFENYFVITDVGEIIIVDK